jgi:cytochrome c
MKRFQNYLVTGCMMVFITGNLHAETKSPEGKQLYDKNCGLCHSMTPPPKSAPPILGIALHYHDAFSEKEKAVKHMVMFMKKPDGKNSKLEAQAISRFGLMPASMLSEAELNAAAEWLWDSYDPLFKSPGNCGK